MDGGSLAATLEFEPARWSLSVRGDALRLAALSGRLAPGGTGVAFIIGSRDGERFQGKLLVSASGNG